MWTCKPGYIDPLKRSRSRSHLVVSCQFCVHRKFVGVSMFYGHIASNYRKLKNIFNLCIISKGWIKIIQYYIYKRFLYKLSRLKSIMSSQVNLSIFFFFFLFILAVNYFWIMSPPMKWGDILFLAPLSVCLSVRPSVTLSCPLYIFWTPGGIYK